MEIVNSVVMSPNAYSIVLGNGNLYVFAGLPSQCKRYALDTLDLLGSVTYSSVTNTLISGSVYDGGYIYAAYYNVNYLLKISTPTMTAETSAVRGSGVVNWDLTTDDTYVYALMANGRREKYLKSNLSTVVSIATAESNFLGASIKDGYLYATAYTAAPAKICKISTDTLTTVATTTLSHNAQNYGYDTCILGNYLYVVLKNAPGWIIKINLGTFEAEKTTEVFMQPERIMAANGWLYVLYPDAVSKIDPNTLQIIDSVSGADIGSGSTPSCSGLTYYAGYLYTLTQTRLAKIYVGEDGPPTAQSYSFVIGGGL